MPIKSLITLVNYFDEETIVKKNVINCNSR